MTRTQGHAVLPDLSTLVHDVQRLDAAAYARVLDATADGLREVQGVRWIGQYGHVAVPGVSDLDVVLVCDDEAYGAVTQAAAKATQATPESRYLFHHEMLVLPASCTPRLSAVHAVENLRTLWGATPWQPDTGTNSERAILRQVLWGTSALNNILHICAVHGASMRQMLIRLAVIAKTTSRNHALIGDNSAALDVVRETDEIGRAHV